MIEQGALLAIFGAMIMIQAPVHLHWSLPIARLWSMLICIANLGYYLAIKFGASSLFGLFALSIWIIGIPILVIMLLVLIWMLRTGTHLDKMWKAVAGILLCIAGASLAAFQAFQGML